LSFSNLLVLLKDKLKLLNLLLIGVFGSLIATTMMTLYEIPFWRKWGLTGVFEWHENQILWIRFFRTSGSDVHYDGIFFLHFLNGTLGGLLFPFVVPYFVNPDSTMLVTLAGIVYGLLLWLFTLVPIHKPITGLAVWNHPLGHSPAFVSVGGHVIYGVVMGLVAAYFI
jgi:hypothetical protein